VFCPDTFLTDTAVHAKLTVGAFAAVLITFGADLGTLRAASAADTNIFGAHFTGFAIVAEVSISSDAVLANVTTAANLFVCAVRTFFATLRAYRCAVGAAVTASADLLNAVFTLTAFLAVVTFTADAIPADSTSAAKLVISTVFTLFAAFGANYCTVGAALTTVADLLDTVFT